MHVFRTEINNLDDEKVRCLALSVIYLRVTGTSMHAIFSGSGRFLLTPRFIKGAGAAIWAACDSPPVRRWSAMFGVAGIAASASYP